MRIKQSYVVMTFRTTTGAIAMEKTCRQMNIPGRLIPLPPSIDAGCGLAWRVLLKDYDRDLFDLPGITFERIVYMDM